MYIQIHQYSKKCSHTFLEGHHSQGYLLVVNKLLMTTVQSKSGQTVESLEDQKGLFRSFSVDYLRFFVKQDSLTDDNHNPHRPTANEITRNLRQGIHLAAHSFLEVYASFLHKVCQKVAYDVQQIHPKMLDFSRHVPNLKSDGQRFQF